MEVFKTFLNIWYTGISCFLSFTLFLPYYLLQCFLEFIYQVMTWIILLGEDLIGGMLKNPSNSNLDAREVQPACLNNPEYGQHSTVQLQNIKLHYVENGDKTKPLMLMIHGFPEFWYSWRHQIKEFSKDYWTVAIDMRGYGESDKPHGISNYDMDVLVEDVHQLITALGRNKCTLVAHDWGGAVGWHFLFKYQDLIEKYIIMDAAYSPIYIKLAGSNWKQFLSAWYILFFQLPVIPEFILRHINIFEKILRDGKMETNSNIKKEDIQAYKYTFGKPGAFTPPINYYRCNARRSFKMLELKDVNTMPKGLLMLGENDRYFQRDLLRLSAEAVPNLTTHIVPNANHFVQQDEPEAVNKAMRDFLILHN